MASPENPRGITWNAPRGYQGKAKGLDAANAELREEMGLVLSTTDARGQSHPLTPLPGVAQNQDTAWFNHNLLDENGDCRMVDGEIVRGGLLPMGLQINPDHLVPNPDQKAPGTFVFDPRLGLLQRPKGDPYEKIGKLILAHTDTIMDGPCMISSNAVGRLISFLWRTGRLPPRVT
jgi:hypothetical protein